MKLNNLTGATSYAAIQIEKPITKLLIGNQTSAFNAETISIDFVGKSGKSKTICRKVLIKDLAEISQYGEGYNFASLSTAKVDGLVNLFQIDLCGGSGVKLNNDEYIVVTLENTTAGDTLEIYGMETFQSESLAFKYNFNNINTSAATSRVINTDPSMEALCIDLTSGFDKILFNFPNASVSYTKTEVRQLMRDINDISFSADTLLEGDAVNQTILSGVVKWARLQLPEGCSTVELFTTAATLNYCIIEIQEL